jgi:hypothetical protein
VAVRTGSTTTTRLSSAAALWRIQRCMTGRAAAGFAPKRRGSRPGDVVVGAGRRVAAERLVVGRHRARRAERGVGVVVAGPDAAAGEFAERVSGLVRPLAAAKHRHRVRVVGDERPEFVLDAVERLRSGGLDRFVALPDQGV